MLQLFFTDSTNKCKQVAGIRGWKSDPLNSYNGYHGKIQPIPCSSMPASLQHHQQKLQQNRCKQAVEQPAMETGTTSPRVKSKLQVTSISRVLQLPWRTKPIETAFLQLGARLGFLEPKGTYSAEFIVLHMLSISGNAWKVHAIVWKLRLDTWNQVHSIQDHEREFEYVARMQEASHMHFFQQRLLKRLQVAHTHTSCQGFHFGLHCVCEKMLPL